jgi:hypothetical protein
VYALDSSPIFRRCTFVRNRAGTGAAIVIEGESNSLIDDCEIRDNTAVGLGGGIGVTLDAHALIRDCLIIDNNAGTGGAINVENATATIEHCTLSSNHADFGGGIDMINGYDVQITDTVIDGNVATTQGGGVYLFESSFAIMGGRIADNVSHGFGGAGWTYGSNGYLYGTIVRDNTAPTTGGLHLDSETTLAITEAELYGNGVAVYVEGSPAAPCDARHNWWGHASGPYHPVLNPAGLGDEVGDHVEFTPWNGAAGIGSGPAPGVAPIALSFANPVALPLAVDFTLPGAATVSLDVYDVHGRLVARLADGPLPAGHHAVTWQPGEWRDTARGGRVYFVRLRAGDASLVRKAVVVR